MVTEVEILGHKAKVDRIHGRSKKEPWLKEDGLLVWLTFDEAVGSTLSFGIHIPAKKYDQAELLRNIRLQGEKTLRRIQEKDEKEERGRREKQERQIVLDAMATDAWMLLK